MLAFNASETRRMGLRPLDTIVSARIAAKMTSFSSDVLATVSTEFVTKLPPLTNSIGLELKLIPAGTFIMGSSRSAAEIARLFDSEAELHVVEHPQHRVQISQPFYLGTTEVTQGQWKQVMETVPWLAKEYVKIGSDYPAIYVTWEDAAEFCRKLSTKEGVTYRLPTEAEWEYACRAGSSTMYSFGDDSSQLGSYAWFAENTRDVSKLHAQHVATRRANAWGLFDMHGNVAEWCQDWFDRDHYADSPPNESSAPESGLDRVFRGGGWCHSSQDCRSASRLWYSPDYGIYIHGFRVARDLVNKSLPRAEPSEINSDFPSGDGHSPPTTRDDVSSEEAAKSIQPLSRPPSTIAYEGKEKADEVDQRISLTGEWRVEGSEREVYQLRENEGRLMVAYRQFSRKYGGTLERMSEKRWEAWNGFANGQLLIVRRLEDPNRLYAIKAWSGIRDRFFLVRESLVPMR